MARRLVGGTGLICLRPDPVHMVISHLPEKKEIIKDPVPGLNGTDDTENEVDE
jgi:hypothetical protein